jgi:hypothetical protein
MTPLYKVWAVALLGIKMALVGALAFASFGGRAAVDSGTVTAVFADVCVYGASGSGIFAAVAAAREGFSVVLVEPTQKIGGLLGTGFRMQQDVPEPWHLGGLTGEFYRADMSIPQGSLRHYQGAALHNLRTLQGYLDNYATLIHVIKEHRLVAAQVTDGIINEALFEEARPNKNGVPPPRRTSNQLISVAARVYIDASYEGDLMAKAGVCYRIARESQGEFNESLAGVMLGFAHKVPGLKPYVSYTHRFPNVDPYVETGNPASGLLAPIHPDPLGRPGDASRFFMAYNFKLAWEAKPTAEHPGIPVGAPFRRDAQTVELLRRYVQAGHPLTWPHANFRRGQLMTGAVPGMQTDYPDGDWATRSRIWQAFQDHVRLLAEISGKELRLMSGINDETNGWPMLYIRGGRRLVGEYVMTQQDIQLQKIVPTPVAMGYYKIDIYAPRLAVDTDGTLVHEGDVFVLASPGPYQISYGALIPRRGEVKNLYVTLMMSASHVAYSSIRMEATYMVMGESAGIAAALALKTNRSVQDIDRQQLTVELRRHGQILEWDGGKRRYGTPYSSSVLDRQNELTTRWQTHPEEYVEFPVERLYRHGSPNRHPAH